MAAKIMVIEDDQDILDIITYVLTEQGYEVIAYTQSPALAEIERLQPGLILLDEWLGKLKGSNFCRQLKANSSTCHIPILMLSALNSIESIAFEAGANGYIKKPFDIEKLYDMISAFVKS